MTRRCAPSADSYDPQLALHGTFGDPRVAAPAGSELLVCRDDRDAGLGLGFAFDPATSGPVPAAPVGPWLVFGRDAGVAVTVELPARAKAPEVTLTGSAAALVEASYLEPNKH